MDLECFERLKRFQNPTMDNDGKKCSFQVAKWDKVGLSKAQAHTHLQVVNI
jgi:hypothetical protein